ncbi:MAG: cytochrome c [Xanthomonadaceae bacterium]|nr:cytochrome c [Xanthomonadaceae bacterium]
MKRWLLRALAALLVVVAALVAFVWIRSAAALGQHYAIDEPPLALPTDAASLAHGERVAIMRGCRICHAPDLAGHVEMDVPPIGRLAAPNLTRGHGGLGATLSVADWERAIRHGVAPDGRPLLFMPARDFANLSDADTAALIAWARQVPPVDREMPPPRVGPVGRALFAFGRMPNLLEARLIDQHAPHEAAVAATPTADYGRYLAGACVGCHGEHFSGGAIPGLPPSFPKAANLTPDPATGLGKWSEADFVHTLRTGKRPDGTALDPFMPWRNLAQMNDTEMAALWAYLRTLPPRPRGRR